MPRRRAAPRLYLDRARGQWVIRDGSSFIRTGCTESERVPAEKLLAKYLGKKHEPESGPDPLIADVLLVYTREHLPHTKAAKNATYNVSNLAGWFGGNSLSDISARACRDYAATRSPAAGRRDLETLRAAIRYYSREYGPVIAPDIVLPPKSEPRTRWLTRSEAARLLNSARPIQHLRRFILLGLHTGTRPGAVLRLTWAQIDLKAGLLYRRPQGEQEDAKKRSPPVRLGRRILSHLRRWQRHDAPLNVEYLCHYEGAVVRKLRRAFPQAVKRAGLKGVMPHTLRHTRATWLMQAGVPIWEAAGSLGMSVEILEKVYGKHSPDFQKRAAEV